MRRALLPLVALSTFTLAGCLTFGNQTSGSGTGTTSGGATPKVTGSFGAFTITANVSQTTCGVGALGMPNMWSLVIGLGQDKTTGACTWDSGGGPVAGMCNGAAMSFAGQVVIDMRAGGDGTLPACSIERDDTVSLTVDNITAPTSFSGSMTYTFTPTSNSDCADLYVGNNAQFATLPCTVEYAMSAKKNPAT